MIKAVSSSPPRAPDPRHPAAAGALRREGSSGVDALTGSEWLLANGLGGYAMGTASGVPTRRYHGLLIASISPPVDRLLALHSLVETIAIERGAQGRVTAELANYRFASGVLHPRGDRHLACFERAGPGEAGADDETCGWTWRIGPPGQEIEVIKTLALADGANAATIRYRVRAAVPLSFTIRPLVALRDHHHLLRRDAGFETAPEREAVRVMRDAQVFRLAAEGAAFVPEAQWWHDFSYEHERDRGFDHVEDLFSPGVFTWAVPAGGGTLAVRAEVPEPSLAPPSRGRRERLGAMTAHALAGVNTPASERARVERLIRAADQFVVRRGTAGASIIAGYPWFSDWGRDTLIALPGLLLATGRFDEARRVLETFAGHCRGGLIPNVFNDGTGEAEYNTVDASLWFLRAACEYAREARDAGAFARGPIRDACLQIIDGYRAGTGHAIRVDGDGLVAAGDETTQLTWMDAKRDGVVFTPRHGKPVEVNALWHHGLLAVAGAIEPHDRARAADCRAMAARARAAFAAFWDERRAMLADVLYPAGGGWAASAQVRPNQVFAVSLPHSPLTGAQQAAVVRVVRDRLLTPHGLRTLDPADPGYRPRFEGSMRDRDAAYHNGTVWPWLMGPFAEAVMRSESFSPASRQEARRLLAPLLARLDGEAMGQLPEVFDGDDDVRRPQRPGGCIAQAWSVAETLRVWRLASGRETPGA